MYGFVISIRETDTKGHWTVWNNQIQEGEIFLEATTIKAIYFDKDKKLMVYEDYIPFYAKGNSFTSEEAMNKYFTVICGMFEANYHNHIFDYINREYETSINHYIVTPAIAKLHGIDYNDEEACKKLSQELSRK